MKPITIPHYTKVERKQLLNLRFGQLSKKGVQMQDIIEILIAEFQLSRSVIYSLIDTRLCA